MNESILREILEKTEKYHKAMGAAKDDYNKDMRQILDMMMNRSVATLPTDPDPASSTI
jgi:hypothetical protein